MFWKIYLSITLSIAGIAFIVVNVKRPREKIKEIKIQQKVTVMTKPIQKRHVSSLVESVHGRRINVKKFLPINNRKHNEPMFTGKQMTSLILFSFSMTLTIIFLSTIINPNEVFLHQVLIFEPFFLKIVIPLIYLKLKQDFCRYLARELKQYFSFQFSK